MTVDAKTAVPPVPQGAQPPPPNAITKALVKIAQQLAHLNARQAHLSVQQTSMHSRLATVESHQASSSATAMPHGFPYGMPGYGTTAL
jgi:hypothetical protein